MKYIDHVVDYMRFKIEYEGLKIPIYEQDERHIINNFKQGQRKWGGISQRRIPPITELVFDDEGLPIDDYNYGWDWENKEWLVLSPIRLYWNKHNLHELTDYKYRDRVSIMPLLDTYLVNVGRKNCLTQGLKPSCSNNLTCLS